MRRWGFMIGALLTVLIVGGGLWWRQALGVSTDDAFVRAWHLYLAFSEAAFAERTLADHQLVLTRT